ASPAWLGCRSPKSGVSEDQLGTPPDSDMVICGSPPVTKIHPVSPSRRIEPRQKIALVPSGERRGMNTPSALAACLTRRSSEVSPPAVGNRAATVVGLLLPRLIQRVSVPVATGAEPAALALPALV